MTHEAGSGIKKPISMIAAKSENNVIGKDGGMPWNISDDLKYFKRLTMNCPIIMGRVTHDSIGNLPGRTNIVITRSEYLLPDDPPNTVFHSLDSALEHAQKLAEREIFIIGGAQIYALGMPLADYLYITEIHVPMDGDTYFPKINPWEWREVSRNTVTKDKPDISFSFVKYERIGQLTLDV